MTFSYKQQSKLFQHFFVLERLPAIMVHFLHLIYDWVQKIELWQVTTIKKNVPYGGKKLFWSREMTRSNFRFTKEVFPRLGANSSAENTPKKSQGVDPQVRKSYARAIFFKKLPAIACN